MRDLLICNKFPEPVQAFIGNQRLSKLVMTQMLEKVHDTVVAILERKLTTMKTALSGHAEGSSAHRGAVHLSEKHFACIVCVAD